MNRPLRRGRRRQSPQPAGFTLVELLVVILIIAILIALLVPVIAGAVKAAKNAQVSAEFSNLGTALADFKSRYNEYPPSRIVLHNNGFYSPNDTSTILPTPQSSYGSGNGDITMGDLNVRTSRAMRRYFPKATGYFNNSGVGLPFAWDLVYNPPAGTAWGNVSVNGNVSIILEGHECLVFFLGGIPQLSNGTTYGVTGFSRDPSNPFNPTSAAPNRTVPLFEFAPGRLQDVFNFHPINNGAPNGYPSFVDPLSAPTEPRVYAYFSAYGNGLYDPNDDNSGGYGNAASGSLDANSVEYDDSQSAGTLVQRPFNVGFPNHGTGNVSYSTAPNPYTIGNSLAAANGQPVTWANPQTYQLLCAGIDGLWGPGGAYDQTSTNTRLPVFSTDSSLTPPVTPYVRQNENDNITNFAAGKLN